MHDDEDFTFTVFGILTHIVFQFYSLPELVDRFDHTLLRTNNTKLDFDKLQVINQRLLVDKASDPTQLPSLLDQVKTQLDSDQTLEDDAVLAGHLKWLASEGRIHTLADLTSPNNAFLWSGPKNIDYSGTGFIYSRTLKWALLKAINQAFSKQLYAG